MPVPTRFGAMSAALNLAVGAGSVASVSSTNLVVPNVASAQVGDLCLISWPAKDTNTVNPAGGAGGWTRLSRAWTNYAGFFWNCWFKVLVASDITALNGGTLTIAAGSTDGGEAVSVMVYRGPTTAAVINNSGEVSSTTTTLTNAGFTKSISSKEIVGIVCDRGGQVATTPSGFAPRTSLVAPLAQTVADRSSASYVNGTAVNWSIASAAGQFRIAFLLELT